MLSPPCAPGPRRARAGGRRPIGRRGRSRNPADSGRSPPRAPSDRRRAAPPARRASSRPLRRPRSPAKAAKRRRVSPPAATKARCSATSLSSGLPAATRGESGVQRLERGALDPPDRRIVDQPGGRGRRRGRGQRRERGLGGCVARQVGGEHVDQDRVEEAPVRRVVGARPLAVVGEQHVHRADAEIGRAGAAGRLGGERERLEVADPLVAVARRRA